jgi:hypothetical protein
MTGSEDWAQERLSDEAQVKKRWEILKHPF